MDPRVWHAVRLARWLLPWVGMLAVSSALASAADEGLHRVLVEPTPTPTLMSIDPGSAALRVIQIEITDHDNKPVSHFTCVAHLDGRSSDVVQISDNFIDVRGYMSSVCVTPAEPLPG